MTFESALTIFVIMIIYVSKPGPTILALIARSLSDGFSSGVAMIFGNATAHLIYFLIAAYGFALIEAHLTFLSFLLKSLGAAYLIYIGIKGIMHLEAGMWGGKPDIQTQITPFENYMTGLTICISSPFTILFYVAIIPQFLDLGTIDSFTIIMATFLIVGTYMMCHLIISYLCSRMRDSLRNEKLVRNINLIVSIIFIGLGLFFIASLMPIFDFDLTF